MAAETGAVIRVTLSIGIATLGPEHQTPGDLVSQADEALYRAKQAGRNRIMGAE
jgi:two-component system cell cycle response regulator